MRQSLLFTCVSVFLFVTTAIAGADESAPSLLATGHVDEALNVLRSHITQSPNDAVAHNLLCRAYLTLGDWDRGISACERAVSLAPDNSQYHLWLGRVYGEKADRSGWMTAAGLAKHVRSEFETAVRLNPRNVDARTDLAEFYLEAPGIVGGGRDKAEAQAASLLSLDPPMAHWVKARLAEKKGDVSTAEAEYMALSAAVQESIFLRRLLGEIGAEQKDPTVIHVDNQACISMSKDPVAYKRSKHIDIRYHFTRDAVENGMIQIEYVKSQDNVADLLTKALPTETFGRLAKTLIQ